jgi:hypothetical protein
MILHRINGYLVLLLLVPSTVCGAVVARRAYVANNLVKLYVIDSVDQVRW